MAGFGEWLFGTKDKLNKVSTETEGQQRLHNDVLSQAMGLTGQGGGYNQAQDYYKSLFEPGNQAYENFAAPFMNQFNEQVLPQIAERFAGGGALSSSGFGQALGGAGAGLQSQLAQLFSQLQSQAAGAQTNQYNQLAQTGLGTQAFGYHETPGSAGFLSTLLGGSLGTIGNPIGNALGKGIVGLFKQKSPPGTPGNTGTGGLS